MKRHSTKRYEMMGALMLTTMGSVLSGCSPREMKVGLVSAAERGDTKLIRQYLNNGVDPNEKDADTEQTPLIAAAAEGQTDAIEILAKNGAKLNEHDGMGDTALIAAILNRHTEAALLLLRLGADPNARGDFDKSPLQRAKDLSEDQVYLALKKHGAK